ncbi:MAG: site-specific integrase [Nitrospirales bacterium]
MARKGSKDRGVTFKDGVWWVRLYANSRERWFRCETKSQAKALYGRLKAEQREGRYFPKKKRFPFQVIALNYETAVDATRHGRIGDDRARVKKWIDVFKDQDARAITPEQVEHALLDLKAEQHKPGTIHRYFTVLKAILNRVTELKLVRAEICQRVRLPKYDNEIVRYLTNAQEETLLGALLPKYNGLVVVALNTGLRQSELLRLTWADVDWQTGILTVSRTKGGKSHRVPMNSVVQDLLSRLKLQGQSPTDSRLFPFQARAMRRVFERAIKKSSLSPFRFHDLRHTFASRLAMQGENDRTIMALGGWKSPAMLSRYAHLSPAHLWKAVEGLAKQQTGSKTGSTSASQEKEVLKSPASV